MCLLVVLSRVHPDAPLVVGANRDEWLARPALPMVRLTDEPRTLGGRDQVAGGTWLAVSEHGVVAALTNRPTPGGRDPSKRSRGELPLLLTRQATAEAAAAALVASVDPLAYNPCWVLVGDRTSLYYIDLGGDTPLSAQALAPGPWVLENRPLTARSPKAEAVRADLDGLADWRGPALFAELGAILQSHRVPEASDAYRPGSARPPAADAPCVHAGPYGTRTSTIVVVPPGEGLPLVEFTDGPRCQSPVHDAAGLW